jgi:hypothetical protein
MVAFAMPVMTADAASHEKMMDKTEKTMEKGKEEGKEAMGKTMDKMKTANPCHPDKPKDNPCNPGKPKN